MQSTVKKSTCSIETCKDAQHSYKAFINRVHTVWKVREESTFYTSVHEKSGKVRVFEKFFG